MRIALVSAVLVASLACVALAAVVYQLTITTTMTVTGYEMQLWNVGTGTAVTSIPWGGVQQGGTIDSDAALGLSLTTHQLTVKNTGDLSLNVAWQIDPSTPLPSGVTVTASVANSNMEPYQTWDANNFARSVAPGGTATWFVRWTVSVNGAARGSSPFNIMLLGATSGSG